MDEEAEVITAEELEAETAAEDTAEEEQGPVHDPHNRLYTVLSLIIFLVGLGLYKLISANITIVYAQHEAQPDEVQCAQVAEAFGFEELPRGADVEYIRLSRNFDGNRLYMALSLDENTDSGSIIPFDHGDADEDVGIVIYPEADMNGKSVNSTRYVSSRDPFVCCYEYEYGGRHMMLYSSSSYDKSVIHSFEGVDKIPADKATPYT